jgi:predicted ATPase
MRFQFEKLGYFDKKTEIELGDLTIICGKNNMGKTFASYAIYGFLKTWNSNIDFKIGDEIQSLLENGVLKLDLKSLEKNIPSVLNEISKQYTEYLSMIFSANENYFSKATFQALIAADYQPTYKVCVLQWA